MVRPCGGVQPGLERALTSGGENVLLAGSRSPLAEPQQAGLGEHGQFAVDLATGDPEERPESLISGGDQLATGHRARVQQSEQGGRRGVQVAHPPTVPRLPGTCPQWSTITVHCAFTRESRPWSNDPGGRRSFGTIQPPRHSSRLLRETGLTPAVADLRATLAYAAYLGHAQLALTTPGALPRTSRARKELIDELAAVLLG